METRGLLKSIQRNFLSTTTRAMRTTPTDALALGMPALDLFVKHKAETTAY